MASSSQTGLPPMDDKGRKISVGSRSSSRPPTRNPPNSAGYAHSTREPSRELPPTSAGLYSTLDSESELERGWRTTNTTIRSRSGSRGRRVSSVSSIRGEVLGMYDSEIARLKPEHEGQVRKVEDLKHALVEARKFEKKVAREQTLNRAERLQRRLKVTSRMQAVVRGWLVRKRIIAALDKSKCQNLRQAAMLPDLLRTQLIELQHGVHDLEFRPEDREAAATKLQAWWRAMAGRRVVEIVKLSIVLQVVTARMAAAAVVVQAWYRGVSTKLRMRNLIRLRLLERRKTEVIEMQHALRCIIQIQRAFRTKLAWRSLCDRQAIMDELKHEAARFTPESNMEAICDDITGNMVDTWGPVSTPCAVPAGSGNAGVVIRDPPRLDREVEKIESRELVPFYDVCAEHQIRHQIGGPLAVMMQEQLSLAEPTLALTDGDGDTSSKACTTDLALLEKQLGSVWPIYPDGLTQGFLPTLDEDAWEKGGRAKSQRNALRIRGVQKRKRRKSLECGPRPCTVVVGQAPLNAEGRIQLREERRKQSIQDGKADIADADPHPMFINAPTEPPAKPGRPRCSARYVQSHPYQGDDDEGSWGNVVVESPPPTHRKTRDVRAELQLQEEIQEQWNTLGVPMSFAEPKKSRPGEVCHERVWSIAQSLAQQLPALTAG